MIVPSRWTWIGLAAVSAGLAFSTLGLVILEHPVAGQAADVAIAYLAAANAFLIFAGVTVSAAYADSRRFKRKMAAGVDERMAQLLIRLHEIFYACTRVSAYILRNEDEKGKLDDCVRESSEFLKTLVNETRVMFEESTRNECAVSIKLLVAGKGGNPEIHTYLRDSKSQRVRKDLYSKDGEGLYFVDKNLFEGEGRYPYEEHSPFVDIVSGSAGQDYFLSNDLKKAASKGLYKNGNKHWRKLYNATLIVPIRESGIVPAENLLGFLCIDSFNAKFDEAVSLGLARIVANIVFYLVYSLSVFESRRAVEKKAS